MQCHSRSKSSTVHRTHQFYSILVKAAFNSRPGLIPFFTSRMVELTLQHGFCVHSIHALVTFSATYCVNNLVANVKEASKIGKMAIATLNKRFSSSPEVAQVSRRNDCFFSLRTAFVLIPVFVSDLPCLLRLRFSFCRSASICDGQSRKR